ncbi:MAG: hypothetical protein KAQ85_09825, partial [Thermodesulfovibrionia bacterium]|nr:hypothetical protein [Thermodesulfovibrionia bacterium]
MFNQYMPCPEDCIENEKLIGFAKEIIYHPETNKKAIRNRQEMLRYFMAHPDLSDIILSTEIPVPPIGGSTAEMFQAELTRAKGYTDLLEKLSYQTHDSPENQINKLSKICRELSGEEAGSLKELIREINRPLTLEASIDFKPHKYLKFHNTNLRITRDSEYKKEEL